MRKSPLDTRPERRALRIYAFDPMLGRGGDHRVTVEVPYRDIAVRPDERGFQDDRLEVVDYDAATKTYYRAVNLEDAKIAMQRGLEPSEADPQFHQQMVYAVASLVLENFDRALGRRLRFWGGQRLRLMPHAFQGRNAYYDDDLNAVLFGYFPADEDDPGPNLPGQTVFTCLSHDIVAHEVAHAALDRLHQFYREPTNPHVPALHEAFADIVAMFQRFTFPEVVRFAIRETRNDLMKEGNPLLDIGAQFGAAAGHGAALRRIVGKPDPSAFAKTKEPHRLGWILVSAIYEGFVKTYERRTADLIRIATGGSGRLPDGEMHPDLVNRLAAECARTAQSVLLMCIRATDYLPPVDPTFSDYLRAMVTADFELNRTDEVGLRASMIEAFRLRGIRPEAVGSLAVESVLLEAEDENVLPDPVLANIARRLLDQGAIEISRHRETSETEPTKRKKQTRKVSSQAEWIAQQRMDLSVSEDAFGEELREDEEPDVIYRSLASELGSWVKANLHRLGLDPGRKAAVRGFHPVHRVAAGGELLLEMVVKYVQTKKDGEEDLGGLTYRAGVTVIVTVDGRIRYLIRKPFHESRREGLKKWVDAFDYETGPSWPTGARPQNRMMAAFSARAMDSRRWR